MGKLKCAEKLNECLLGLKFLLRGYKISYKKI